MIILPPPQVSQYSYGTRLIAGLGHSTIIADFDFETYSEAGFVLDENRLSFNKLPGAQRKGLTAVGAAVYAEHPSTEVICLAYDLKDGKGRRLWKPSDLELPFDLFGHVLSGKLLEAWNISFEYWIWRQVCRPKYKFPFLHFKQVRCAMAKSRAFSLPGSLDKCGKILNTDARKNKRGKQLIDLLCIPHNITQKRKQYRITSDKELHELYEYNLRDIETEAEISSKIPDLENIELEFWQSDQYINQRGVAVDIHAIDKAISFLEQTYEKYNRILSELTNGQVTKASQVQKFMKWLESHNVRISSLDEESLDHLLNKTILSPVVYQALSIRKLLNSASVKKLYSLKNRTTSKERVHDLFVYHSAKTGRAAGSGPQPQNLPGPLDENWTPEVADTAIELIKISTLKEFESAHPRVINTISACLRGMFISSPGCDLLCSDYSAIEAVVLAELSGEEWRQEVFRSHGKIYEMSASKITGMSFNDICDHKEKTGKHHSARKIGKVAELASGYQGWIGAWCQFGADKLMEEEEIKRSILSWREASPKIVEMWGGYRNGVYFGIEGAAIQAVLFPGNIFEYRGITYLMQRNILYCQLLSGRYMIYHNPQLNPSERRFDTLSLSYEGWNTNPKNGKVGWIRMNTYGGKLVENIVQATARDILAYAIVQLERNKYPVVLHVHDEIVCEVPQKYGSIDELEAIMSTMPIWAKDWPVRAKGGWRAKRYSK